MFSRLMKMSSPSLKRTIVTFKDTSKSKSVLTPECVQFLETIHNNTSFIKSEMVHNRKNKKLDFREDTKSIRNSDWKVSPYSEYLQNRHVELTGPGNDAKMVINALNSNASGYMFDMEDSMSPSWYNVMNAHHNMRLLCRNKLTAEKKDSEGNVIKEYKQLKYIDKNKSPTLFLRARGLHMNETNFLVNNSPIQATLFDLGTHLFHNGHKLVKNEAGPYIYIPKLESYEDAIYVKRIIKQMEEELYLPKNSVKVTVLIETFPAIFQTEEIIYALKNNIVGLNCGRWDYLFGMIKSLGNDKIMPYRSLLSMDKPFMEAYVKQIVTSCHKRGIHAMGGMSAFIPTGDEVKDAAILDIIKNDKLLEISRGCDGAWVAHPGLIEPIKNLFEDTLKAPNQIDTHMNINLLNDNMCKVTKSDIINFEPVKIIDINDIKSNINIALQYISAWLSGNGAVALNNLMEDLATSEISVFQIKQWLNSDVSLDNFGHKDFNEDMFLQLLETEYNNIVIDNQVSYADRYFRQAKNILKEYVLNDKHNFLPDVATKHLNIEHGYKAMKWDKKTLHKLTGSKGHLSGLELTKHRGEYLNKFLYEDNNPAYKFLGTSNGVSAVNVVAGGKGKVGPYAGGWQHNAMSNRLHMCLPDTLHVAPEESANCAFEINNHLHRADAVQHIQKLDNPDINTVNYYDMAMLCDLEQGWCTPEKVRIGTQLAIKNGINVIHIEDQGEKKRCGHLGDKELNTYDDYALMMRSANLAAQELLGPEQADKKWVRFVARTDALSAKRIHNSKLLYSKMNPEHKFVDWGKGTSPDGKYLYLKQGINEETGNSWGLDLSIYRGSRIVDEGLATHVWMETPDADLNVAKAFMNGVNDILEPKGKMAYALYNHSPSFDWDVKFYTEAEKLAKKIIDWSFQHKNGKPHENYELHINDLKHYLYKHGELIQGDHLMNNNDLHNITLCLKDFHMKDTNWQLNLNSLKNSNYPGFLNTKIDEIVDSELLLGYNPIRNMSNIIVEHRLKEFGNQLSTFGCNMHLITLPEFHVTAYNMHLLSKDFADNGINAFVKNTQRPERIHSENDHTYTYYKHQTATGTGCEAAFNVTVGSHDVNTLSDSTEQDDIKSRKN
jgi:malate synthase